MSVLNNYEAAPHVHIPRATRRVIPISNEYILSVVDIQGDFELALLKDYGDHKQIVHHPLISSEYDEVGRFDSIKEIESVILQLRSEFDYKES